MSRTKLIISPKSSPFPIPCPGKWLSTQNQSRKNMILDIFLFASSAVSHGFYLLLSHNHLLSISR